MKWMTITDAAQALHVSRQRVHNLANRGLLVDEYRNRGRVRVVTAASVQARIEEQARPFGCLRIAEVANRLDKPESTVSNWVAEGHLPSTMKAGVRWVPVTALSNFTPPPLGRRPKETASA